MKAHQRIALALRAARVYGATVVAQPVGGLLRFRVLSPVDVRVAVALGEAGFTIPNRYLDGFRGWEALCTTPGYRATEYLLSLDGEGPLPERAPRAVRRAPPRAPAAPRKPRTRKPRGPGADNTATALATLPPPRDAADLMASLGIAVSPEASDPALDTEAAHAGPAKTAPPVTVLRRTRKAA